MNIFLFHNESAHSLVSDFYLLFYLLSVLLSKCNCCDIDVLNRIHRLTLCVVGVERGQSERWQSERGRPTAPYTELVRRRESTRLGVPNLDEHYSS